MIKIFLGFGLVVVGIFSSPLIQNQSSNMLITSTNKDTIPTAVDSIVMVGGWNCRYLETPYYIKNKDYVVYQYYNTRKIIYPDIESFRVIKNLDKCPVAVDKNGVYFAGSFIEVDTTEIKVVGRNDDYSNCHWLWKNKEKVFRNEKELLGIDAESFQPIECFNGKYFKDKNHVYYFDQKLEGSDGASVGKSCNERCYDKNQIYVNGEVLLYKGEKLIPINDHLAKTESEVIDVFTMKPIMGIDMTSLTKLSRGYSMDKNGVYYGNTKIPIQNANLDNITVWDQNNSAYVTDGIKVYFGDGIYRNIESKLDAKTFGMLPHSDFVFDQNGVYEHQWEEKLKWKENNNRIRLHKFPFKYTEPVTDENTFITDNNRYIVYLDQAYDPWDNKLYSKLSEEQILGLRNQGFLLQKSESVRVEIEGQNVPVNDADLSAILIKDAYPFIGVNPQNVNSNTLAYANEDVYKGDKILVTNNDVEFLAVFSGSRPGCGMDRTPSTNYILVKNKDGYWFVTTDCSLSNKIEVQYLGKTFKSTWNPIFEDFELAQFSIN